MITEKIESGGKVIAERRIEMPEPMVTEGFRARAAAQMVRSLLLKGVTMEDAIKHPDTLQAARDAVDDGIDFFPGCFGPKNNKRSVQLRGPSLGGQALRDLAPELAAEEETEPMTVEELDALATEERERIQNAEAESVIYRRYLLSIVNQRRESFDELENDSILDMLYHPRFNMPVCPYQEFKAAVLNRAKNAEQARE